MPPKVKCTKEQIIEAGLNIAKEKGIEFVTARNLGAKLEISSKPIFRVFENMEEVHSEIYIAARKVFYEYTKEYINYKPAFKQFGLFVIQFATNEPNLFQLLFMREKIENMSFNQLMEVFFDNTDDILEVIKKDYKLNDSEANKLFSRLMVYTYGISVLCAKKVCVFSEEEISEMISEVFMGIMLIIKSGEKDLGNLFNKCMLRNH